LLQFAALWDSLRASPTKKKLIPAVKTRRKSLGKLIPAFRLAELTDTPPLVWQCGQIISGFFENFVPNLKWIKSLDLVCGDGHLEENIRSGVPGEPFNKADTLAANFALIT
jgi:hypothetical protein